ncbi:dipeptidyl peptidase III [Coniochaeta sp. 2T2.1]|nr:dipeptidyl peptidase III [Coniochaeta sp. 2T2.1]
MGESTNRVACDGQWDRLIDDLVTQDDLDAWLEYSVMFLSSVGNSYNDGKRKAIPCLSNETLQRMASISPRATDRLGEILDQMMAPQPSMLGYPGKISQSGYFFEKMTRHEIEAVTSMMEVKKIATENTRLRKAARHQLIKLPGCRRFVETFRTGYYKAFEAAQKTWVMDKAPRVEHCTGLLFCYGDPHGVRAEWQAASDIAHAGETSKMGQLVAMSTGIIHTLPWAVANENDGKGPFEPRELEAPNVTVIHGDKILASVSSTVWEATNITLDNEKGGRHGVNNMVYGNRMNLNSSLGRPCYYIGPFEAERFHELHSHHSLRRDGKPTNESGYSQAPTTWYRPSQKYNNVFGQLAYTVEECRAFLITSYLADNQDILSLFGYNENSTPTADEFLYYTYFRTGDEGIRALHSFKAEDQTWGGDHDRTGDIDACRSCYEALSAVHCKYETWRQLVASKPEPKWKSVQPNTFLLEDVSVELREYEADNAGIIRSSPTRNISGYRVRCARRK